MTEKEIDDIVFAKLSGEELTHHECEAFDAWYSQPHNRRHFSRLLNMRSGLIGSAVSGEVDREEAWNRIRSGLRRKPTPLRRVMKYAAILLLPVCLGLTLYFLTRGHADDFTAIQPGQRQAVLILSDNSRIDLTAATGTLHDKGVVIVNDTDNGLAYEVGAEGEEIPVFHKIVTMRGQEYSLTLSDGTSVWLNSQSSLRYPVRFTGDIREVELEGEAFFEVAGNPDKPFMVRTGDYDVRVTGTAFNIRSYYAGRTSTTLVEGSVAVEVNGQTRRLLPGQQLIMEDGQPYYRQKYKQSRKSAII